MSAMLSYSEIRNRCLKSKTLFVDRDFPASANVLPDKFRNRQVQWIRPNQITSNPRFVVDGFSRLDIQQGTLGDCWFLAGLVTLAQRPKLFHKVVPEDNSFVKDYAGVFHFNFWNHGQWVEVVIDDCLPVVDGVLFCKAPKSEYWGPLVEKAYAKLYGSYSNLEGGFTAEAMIDFTGGVLERYMSPLPVNLFQLIEKAHIRGSLTTASIMKRSLKGQLFSGHAYSITKAVTVEATNPKEVIQLVRIKNPWGNKHEWKGAFCDGSTEWNRISKNVIKKLKVTIDDDGEFYMKFSDFKEYFDVIELCHLSANALDEATTSRQWIESTYHGKWISGTARRPEIVIELRDPDEGDDDPFCTVVISLTQKHRRRLGQQNQRIKFDIFKLNSKGDKNLCGSGEYGAQREICSRFRLMPGSYAIVPIAQSYEGGEFMLRFFTEETHGRSTIITKTCTNDLVWVEKLETSVAMPPMLTYRPNPRESSKIERFCVFLFGILLSFVGTAFGCFVLYMVAQFFKSPM